MLACSNCSAGTHRHVALKQHIERLVVHERAVLERVVAGPQGVLDALGRAAMAGDLEPVVVGLGHHGVHLVERHAQRVMVVGVGRGGVAGGIGLDPLDAVLDQLAHGAAAFVGAVDQQHQPFHADLAEVGVPVHQPAHAADLAAAGGQPRAGHQVLLDRLLQPDVDVEQAAAAAGRRVAALERQLGVGRRQQRDVFDRILDVEVFQLGDVEVGRVKMGLDQPGHDRAAAGVDVRGVGADRRCAGRGPGVGDPAVADHDRGIRDRCGAGAVDQLSAVNERRTLCGLHAGRSLV